MGARVGRVTGLNDGERKAVKLAAEILAGEAIAVCAGGERPDFMAGVVFAVAILQGLAKEAR